MRKLIITFICLVIISSYSFSAPPPYHRSGTDGSSSSPYQISSRLDLESLLTNLSDWNKHFIVTSDITCSGVYHPIGNASTSFTGSFDGQSHIITNLTINSPSTTFTGLFGYTSSATITNVILENVNITGDYFVGGLVGYNENTTISNCSVIGSVNGTFAVGGLVGKNYNSIIRNCFTTVSVDASDTFAGGLVGWNQQGTINNCYATGSVNASIGSICGYAAGLVGYNVDYSTISNSYATGNVNGSAYVGGLAGANDGDCAIINSYATGNVIASDDMVGGLVGDSYSSSTISNCYTTGNVSASGKVGGFAGRNYGNSIISNCYARGNAIGYSDVGGFAGYQGTSFSSGTITNCYSTGSASATLSGGNQGGFCGYNENGLFMCCYWDTNTSGTSDGVGDASPDPSGVTGLTTAQIKQQSIFNSCGWDIDNIWYFDGANYPQLRILSSIATPTLTEWSRYILVFSVLLFGCYFVYRKLYA